MTTAHRPTWAPAKGHEEQGGMRIFAPLQQKSVKDMPSHTTLKFRQEGQTSAADLARKDLRAELEEKERAHYAKTATKDFDEEREKDLRLLQAGPGPGFSDGAEPRNLVPRAVDADDEEDDDDGSDSDSDDDEDDEAELLAELERIKRERAEDAARKAAADAETAEASARAEVVRGNPLLLEKLAAGGGAGGGDMALKRRWDEDVVFRNQARGEPKAQRRFINDTIRNDFHRRFLDKYMR